MSIGSLARTDALLLRARRIDSGLPIVPRPLRARCTKGTPALIPDRVEEVRGHRRAGGDNGRETGADSLIRAPLGDPIYRRRRNRERQALPRLQAERQHVVLYP